MAKTTSKISHADLDLHAGVNGIIFADDVELNE